LVGGVCFNMRALFEYLIEACGLSEDVKHRNVEIAVTVDSARLDGNCQHVTIGFKICDKLGKYTVAGKYFFVNEVERRTTSTLTIYSQVPGAFLIFPC
jgi:hypothetical protein